MNTPSLPPPGDFISSWGESHSRTSPARRRLDLMKCSFCRSAKKKCSPSNRQWHLPEKSKCDRCIKLGFECSEPQRKERLRRASTSRNASDASPNADTESFNWVSRDYYPSKNLDELAFCEVAINYIQQMKRYLRKDICALQDRRISVGTISRENLRSHLPDHAQGACSSWIDMLIRGKLIFLVDNYLQQYVFEFFASKILQWLEASALMNALYNAIDSLIRLEALVHEVFPMITLTVSCTDVSYSRAIFHKRP
jgi:hypothetical protein